MNTPYPDGVFADLGSLCSGYGGLELGISTVIRTRTRWVADYEPPTMKKPRPNQTAADILDYRFPGVPNLGDITRVRWSDTEPVKIVCGGTPCQDVSAAGARAGMRAGTRSGIWSSMVEAIAHHRPTLVVWENVRGSLSATADSNVEPCPICLGDDRECTLRALGRVLGDLSELGYDAVWEVVAASDIGAPHRRERVFVIAWPADPDRDTVRVEPITVTGSSSKAVAGHDRNHADANPADIGHERGRPPRRRWHGPEDHRDHAPNANDAGRSEQRRPITSNQEHPPTELRSGRSAADPESIGRHEGGPEPARIVRRPDPAVSGTSDHADIDWGDFKRAIRRWERTLGRYAPEPRAISPQGTLKLNPAFVEWMQGLPVGWVTEVPGITWNEMLHALGNGVVPQQAAHAIRRLLPHAPEWVRADLGLA